MDPIEKALSKLTENGRRKLKDLLERIRSGDFRDLDLKKLKGRDDVYRVRKGTFRVIFRKTSSGIKVLALERRSDTTYNF